MVERYAREEMTKHWTQHARYAAWLEVEKAAVKAWNKLGLIPDDDCVKVFDLLDCRSLRSVERIVRYAFSILHKILSINIDAEKMTRQ